MFLCKFRKNPSGRFWDNCVQIFWIFLRLRLRFKGSTAKIREISWILPGLGVCFFERSYRYLKPILGFWKSAGQFSRNCWRKIPNIGKNSIFSKIWRAITLDQKFCQTYGFFCLKEGTLKMFFGNYGQNRQVQFWDILPQSLWKFKIFGNLGVGNTGPQTLREKYFCSFEENI